LNYNEIVGGADGLSYHINLGQDRWALPVHMIQYGREDLLNIDSVYPGIIDTGNTSIILPEAFFNKIYEEMKADESSIYVEETNDYKQLKARRPCHKIEDNI
jgi:hypothetical protein